MAPPSVPSPRAPSRRLWAVASQWHWSTRRRRPTPRSSRSTSEGTPSPRGSSPCPSIAAQAAADRPRDAPPSQDSDPMIDPTTLKYAASHEWVKLDGDIATVGISKFAVDQLTDLILIDLPAVGKVVTPG